MSTLLFVWGGKENVEKGTERDFEVNMNKTQEVPGTLLTFSWLHFLGSSIFAGFGTDTAAGTLVESSSADTSNFEGEKTCQ